MKRGKQCHCENIDSQDGAVIEQTDEEGCKNPGILRSDDICHRKMKEKVQKQCYKRVRAIIVV